MENLRYLSKDTCCLIILINKTGVPAPQLFKSAFDYFEMRYCPRAIRQFYENCMDEGIIPDIVEWFCLDVLAGRARLHLATKFGVSRQSPQQLGAK